LLNLMTPGRCGGGLPQVKVSSSLLFLFPTTHLGVRRVLLNSILYSYTYCGSHHMGMTHKLYRHQSKMSSKKYTVLIKELCGRYLVEFIDLR
jgi:hypothetical protein